MTRVNLYTNIHKAIRDLLGATATDVARTDFDDAPAASRAAARVRRTLGFLAEHGEHEDEVVMPELERIAPELFVQLRADHTRVDGLHRELEELADRLDAVATPAERRSLGQRLHRKLWLLCAEHLVHMDREEVEAQRALWAHRNDAELEVLHRRIVGRIPPARLADWFELMLPAIAAPERSAILGGLRGAMPAPVFDAVTARARAALGADAWEACLA